MQRNRNGFANNSSRSMHSVDTSQSHGLSALYGSQWQYGTSDSGRSLVYIKYVEPKEIIEGDVIAFYGSDAEGSIITHRVVSNSSAMGEFITKGDANEENDMNPVTYNQYMGKMVRSIPKIGGIVQTITGGSGKAAVGCVIGLAIVLEIIAAVLNRRLEDDEEE